MTSRFVRRPARLKVFLDVPFFSAAQAVTAIVRVGTLYRFHK